MSKLPYRVKIEVLILKGNLVCVGEKTDASAPGGVSYRFPGGGVEPGASRIETGVAECLEEVGILVKNLRTLGLSKVFDGEFTRDKIKYAGVEKHFYYGEFAKVDTSRLNTEGDAMPFQWLTIDAACKKVQNNGEHGEFRFLALNTLKLFK